MTPLAPREDSEGWSFRRARQGVHDCSLGFLSQSGTCVPSFQWLPVCYAGWEVFATSTSSLDSLRWWSPYKLWSLY